MKKEPEYKINKKLLIKEDKKALALIEEALYESLSWAEVYRANLIILSKRAESFREHMIDEVKSCPTNENELQLLSCEMHIELIREMLFDLF